MVHRIALIRHGESVWNLENIFTGWTDVDLSSTGVKEAIQVGRLHGGTARLLKIVKKLIDRALLTAGRQASQDRGF